MFIFKILKKIVKMENPKITIEQLNSDKTPSAIGPYSKATKVDIGNKYIIFTSGSIGVDPNTNEFASDELVGQTNQAIVNLQNLLE